MEMAKRETTVKAKAAAADRTSRVLDGAVKRLRRLGGRRASKEVKQAYKDAADLVKSLRRK